MTTPEGHTPPCSGECRVDDLRALLEEQHREVMARIDQIRVQLYGNGEPEKGFFPRVVALERSIAVIGRAFWVVATAVVGLILNQIARVLGHTGG